MINDKPGSQPAAPTDAEIEAGAQALASRHFVGGPVWSWDRFTASQQEEFRAKARAVIQAARKASTT